MNRYLSRISVRIMLLLSAVLLMVGLMILVFWRTSVLPVLVASEQTKADLLIGQYAKQLEQELGRGVSEEFVLGLVDEMLLLRDEATDKPLLHSVRIETLEGQVFERFNQTGISGQKDIQSEMPIFSGQDLTLYGTLKVLYNEAYYDEMSSYMGRRLLLFAVLALLVIVVFGFLIERLVRPLKTIAFTLDRTSVSASTDIPDFPRSRTYEINYVASAIGALLTKVRDREERLIEEHIVVEEALQEKLRAEQANMAKSRFLANMSHELRTPLNAVIGYSEILSEDLEHDGANPAYLKDLANIRTSAKHLLSLINDILDISKIEAERVQMYIEPMDLPELLESVIRELRPIAMANNNNLNYEYRANITVIKSDPKRLRQIVTNLISNACKFTHDGTVDLCVDMDRENHLVLITVRDTGIGISDNMIEKVFEAFVQEDNSSVREFEGTGLGLAISKKLSELLGGSLTAQSAVDEGSLFTLSLPFDRPCS